LAKPFSPRELAARVKALLRRAGAPNASAASATAPLFHDDEAGQRISLRGQPLALTRREYRLLACLLRGAGRIHSREALLAAAWGDDSESTDRTVDTHIKTLRAKLREVKAELARLKLEEPANFTDIQAAEEEIERLSARIHRVPFLDTFDLKYNLLVKHPNPSSKAVMFCLMDVSGSMTQATKDIAKRFFILLYLFLKRNYDKIEVVFIRHHTSAKEVDEEEFFYSRETGGTIVSSALKMMQEIMAERYPANEWNIYAAQASDGDNWNDDSPVCRDILINQIMPFVQYFSYVEITPREHQALWYEYNQVAEAFGDSFAQQQLVTAGDIYPVFRELFQRRMAS